MATENKTEQSASELNIPAFWKAQKLDWRITVVRTSLERFGYKMVLPYLTLYVTLLGATKTQIGYLTSIGLILSAFIGPVAGQMIDRFGPKKIYIVGILVLLGAYLSFASAPIWQVAALGVILHQVGQGISGQGCSTVCGNCLANCDRAKGMLICESLAAGVLGMVGPMISGWVLVNLMKVEGEVTDPNSVRPLFLITLFITFISLLVVVFKLSNVNWGSGNKREKHSVIRDGLAILKADKNCVKWVFIAAVGGMPAALVTPYVSLYAAEARHASARTLAAMGTATAFTSIMFGYFFGILSDRYGRKKMLMTTIIFYLIGLTILITTKRSSPIVVILLVAVGICQGFQEIGASLSGSISFELVPGKIMGRWNGVNRAFTALFSAAVAAVAGYIYENIGGQWVFIIYIACELLIRIPLLLTLPETLHYKVNAEAFAALDK